ncbi:hypothetical protein CYLTODRAFT_451016 [Cylindrobasidium torrendii FP15055 ss-10]|uniref:Uncharacterized protein n=1 Tax=Cylindrobasidium torrendii FP15055 ss-10 TaxID=1314674 RepID=A0A0D7BLZ8_9AGAR|nr:hypothetical protein CYLTODRAFT_451016 [Cylindrobasidium torrendii FP15055 ss-10]
MPPADNGRILGVTDALRYLDAVKAEYQAQPHVYNAFLDIMKDFRLMILSWLNVTDNPGGKGKFDTFLPAGYRMAIPAPASPSVHH